MSGPLSSPVVAIYQMLGAADASWHVDIGRPEADGWIAGADMRNARSGPLNELLRRIGERLGTEDRKTIAALFALRLGWASRMAIAPYLRHRVVPDISLDNVAFKFKPSTFLERSAIYEPRGTLLAGDAVAGDPGAEHAAIATVPDDSALLGELRRALTEQAGPIVEGLYEWSGFARRGTWGMLTSAWAAQFIAMCDNRNDQRAMQPTIEAFFAGSDDVSVMQPRLHTVVLGEVVQLFQRRASCCRWYLLPQGGLCASCPLVPQDERVRRNLAWMTEERERVTSPGGHK